MPRVEQMASAWISGVILAAGTATRMGRAKQLMPVAGRSILQHVIDAAAASRLGEVVVVLGCCAEQVAAAIEPPSSTSVRLVVNERYEQGLASSLQRGLRACDPRAVAAAILLGDHYGADVELIDSMLDAFAATARPALRPVFFHPGAVPTPGHPVVLARELWDEVDALHGDEGAREILTRCPERLCEVRVDAEPPVDVDTWADYRRAVDRARACGNG